MKFKRILTLALTTLLALPTLANAATLPTGPGESPSNPGFFYPGKTITIPAPQSVDPSLTYIGVMLHRMQPASPNDTNAANYTTPVTFAGKEEWYIPASGSQEINLAYNNTDVKAFFASAKYGSIIYPEDPRQTPTNLTTNNSIFKLNVMYLFRLSDGTDKKGAIRSMYIQLAPVPISISTKWGAYTKTDTMKLTMEMSQAINIKAPVKIVLSNGDIVTSDKSTATNTKYLTFTYPVSDKSARPLKVVGYQNSAGTDITNSRHADYHDTNTSESLVQWIIPEDKNMKDGSKFVVSDSTPPNKYTGGIGRTNTHAWISQNSKAQLKAPTFTDAHSGIKDVGIKVNYPGTPFVMDTDFTPTTSVTGQAPARNIYPVNQSPANVTQTKTMQEELTANSLPNEIEETLPFTVLLTDSIGHTRDSAPINMDVDTWAPDIPIAWRGESNTIHFKIREHMAGVGSVIVEQRAENGSFAAPQTVSLATLLETPGVTDKDLPNYTLGFVANQPTSLYPGARFTIKDNAGNTRSVTFEVLNSPAEVLGPNSNTMFINGDLTSQVNITATIKDSDSSKIGFNLRSPQIRPDALLPSHYFIGDNLDYKTGVHLSFPVTYDTLHRKEGIYNDLVLQTIEYNKQTETVLYTGETLLPSKIIADITVPEAVLTDVSKIVNDGKQYIDLKATDKMSGIKSVTIQYKAPGAANYQSIGGQLLSVAHPTPDPAPKTDRDYTRQQTINRRYQVIKGGTFAFTITDNAGNQFTTQLGGVSSDVPPTISYKINGTQCLHLNTSDKTKNIAISQNTSPNPLITMQYTDFVNQTVALTTRVIKEDGTSTSPIYNTITVNPSNGIGNDIQLQVKPEWGTHFQIVNSHNGKEYVTDMFLLTDTVFTLQNTNKLGTTLNVIVHPAIKDKVPKLANTKQLAYTTDSSNTNYQMFGDSPTYVSGTTEVYKNRGIFYSLQHDPVAIESTEYATYSMPTLTHSKPATGAKVPKADAIGKSSLTLSGLWSNALGMEAPQSILSEDNFALTITVQDKTKKEPFNPEVGFTKKGYTFTATDSLPWNNMVGYDITYYILNQADYTGDWGELTSKSPADNESTLLTGIKAPMVNSKIRSYAYPNNIAEKLISTSGNYYVLVKATSPLGKDYYGANTLNVLFSQDSDSVVFKDTTAYRLNRSFLFDIATNRMVGHNQGTAPLTYRAVTNDKSIAIGTKGKSTIALYKDFKYSKLLNLTGTLTDMRVYNNNIYVATTSGLYMVDGTSLTTIDSSQGISAIAVRGVSLLTANGNTLHLRTNPNAITSQRTLSSVGNIIGLENSGNTIYALLDTGKVVVLY